MAHQDYIARPRAPKKKKNPYKAKGKKPVANNSGLKPVFIGLIIVAIVTGFSYFLYSLKNNSSDLDTTEIELSTPAKQQEEDILPPPPTEKWTYFDELQNKVVEVDSYDVKQKGPYQMQCASFRNKKDAEVLKAKIAFTGLSSKIRKAKGTSGIWYKVVLGPFERKRMAENAKHKLKRNKINGCQIWLWT
ncbi:SPOR domain-containing protein [Colwelliaceae bacterium BS250]